MTYELWRETTRLMISFYELDSQKQEMILLMMDGLKFREQIV